MKKIIWLYVFLFSVWIIEINLAAHTPWIANLVMVTALAGAVFLAPSEAIILCVICGLLSDVFSVNYIPLNIIILPFIGAISLLISNLLYKNSPSVQMSIVLVAYILIIFAHSVYFGFMFDNNPGIYNLAKGGWKSIITTTAFSPLIFLCVSKISEMRN